MAEYIEREAFYRFLTDQKDKETGAYSKGRNAGLDVARSALHNSQITPAADVAPVVHGRWIEEGGVQICSNCGEEHSWEEYRATYCEDCGARMDGDG